MCGIFAAINKTSVTNNLLSGLSSLSYRGYDSAGIAVVKQGAIQRVRAPGKIDALESRLRQSPLEGNIGIAHTRWATHGLPNETNAHPHMTSRVAVAHNGIVENYETLRRRLEKSGYIFESETDSETISQLITYYLDLGLNQEQSLCKALSEVEGSYGVAVIFQDDPNTLYAARKGSPLILGKSEDGFYVSSDINAFCDDVTSITYLKDGDVARLNQEDFSVFNLEGQKIDRLLQKLEKDGYESGKQGYDHFMLKEIHEQPDVFERTWRHYFNNQVQDFQLPELNVNPNDITSINIVACGTSFFAGMVAKYWIEEYAQVPVNIDIASEFRYRKAPLDSKSLAIFISQSGETADTLAAMEHAKKAGMSCVSFVNVLTSTMAMESDAVLPTLAGPEIGVASTKAFISQLTSLLIFTLSIEQHDHNPLTAFETKKVMERMPHMLRDYLSDTQDIQKVAQLLVDANNMLYLGRGIAYPLAEEGALKIKEISYIHAEAYPAGELKHGPLALVDENMPVVVIAPPDELFSKTLSNLREVASRGGKIILISNRECLDMAKDYIQAEIELPDVEEQFVPILYTLPLQLLAYYVALGKGHDVDQPRNLAKSVTVE